tara:strand:- start:53 stop:436 length:384 start_codon:yes stop_codon:yes gene_type:complete
MTTTISGSNGIVFPDLTSMQTGQQAVKAWVNFNGVGTVAIRAGYNVASITDTGTGNYTVNFTTAMPDANYAVGIGVAAGNGLGFSGQQNGNLDPNVAPAVGALALITSNSINGASVDFNFITAIVSR